MTIGEAADMLGIGRSLAYEMARDGRLPTVALGARRYVVPLKAVEHLLDQSTEAADAQSMS